MAVFIRKVRSTVLLRHRFSASISSSEATELVKRSFPKDGIAYLTLNDPKKRNALSFNMLSQLKEEFADLANKKGTRVIIVNSEGPVFSSGHNLKELLSENGKEFHQQIFHKCSEVMQLIQDIPIPVIAQVRGLATAAGCQLVASCDIAVASDKAQFATPGVKIGLFCSTPGVALSRAVPRKKALQMLFTGDPISAQDALLHGLVSHVVPEDKLEEETMEIATKICNSSSAIIGLGKACFYQQINMNRNQAYQLAEGTMVHNLGFVDGQEGIEAFVAKRQPVWSNK
ncbi:enoyl-CoA hydratase domain-containing protein 3, mitochondrial-like [Dysidea avara]|uniref:enoyl-CoA hydratase domain-containing protein 3, mitochondrial-like n=1 Tax=Dysidea avara TaxID=196820 RepID=UPI00332FD187